ncbi:MAG: thymidylate synthase [Oscillatoria princeps RMCB-10]|nr:thymidylate synthase [Oscillatoria princeps RMCB-10]
MFRNATWAFAEGLRAILSEGETIAVRGQTTREVRSHLIRIASPLERVYVIPHRNNNIFAQIAETLWVIAGRNDMAFLSRYLPRAADFSDDGKVWRGGYGPRLRNWHGADQLKEVTELLKNDRNSRRAVMMIFDPAQDFVASKDIPCNNWLHFIIRDGKLHLAVAIRSNDIWWGFSGINTFEWSVLHEMVAYWTGTEVGEYAHFASSFHLYDRHFPVAEKVLANWKGKTLYDFGFASPRFSTPLEEFDETVARLFATEEKMRQGETGLALEIGSFKDSFLRNCLEMLYIYNRHLNGADREEIVSLLEALPANDFKIGAVEYFSRKLKSRDFLNFQGKERDFFQFFWGEKEQPVADKPAESHSFASILAKLSALHYKKSLVYKDSWKKHGEVLGVFANITRKYDRIETILAGGVKTTSDESLLDTVGDLAVYSAKYLTYLAEHYEATFKDFTQQYPPQEPLERYWYNEGFDAAARLLVRRYESSGEWEAIGNYDACFAAMTKYYKGLEDVLINGDWRAPEPRKCSLAADLAISAIHYLVLASVKEPDNLQKFAIFIERL